MPVQIFNDTKIFVACPANFATGGPELLHQLVYNLQNILDIDAKILYYNFDSSKYQTPVHPDYLIYKTPWWVLYLSKDEDKEHNILIVPEVYEACLLLNRYSNIRKGIWFLSVDNYYLSRLKKWDLFFPRMINKISKLFRYDPIFEISIEKLNLKKKKLNKDSLLKYASFFMTNAYRGVEWLKSEEISPVYYLSEYLNESFLKIETDIFKKEDIVAYNPKKGFPFTRKIMKYAAQIKFIPIINMSREEVMKILQRAKVYIDFGNHSGKDRLPREAVILSCCVIAGKRGSAVFYEDVPIPEEYKFEDKKENIPAIIQKIKDCFENFEDRYKDFEHYRRIIKQEPQKFIEDLKNIFIKV